MTGPVLDETIAVSMLLRLIRYRNTVSGAPRHCLGRVVLGGIELKFVETNLKAFTLLEGITLRQCLCCYLYHLVCHNSGLDSRFKTFINQKQYMIQNFLSNKENTN